VGSKQRILTQEGIPGQNLGEVFTASIANRQIIVQKNEGYWDSLMLAFRGTETGVVTLNSFLALVNPLLFVANEPRISLRGRDMYALSAAFYGIQPRVIEGATGTTDSVFGIRIPLWVKTKTSESYAWNATRIAVSNIASEVVHLSLQVLQAPPAPTPGAFNNILPYRGPGRIDAREIPFTTPGSTGITQVTPKLPKLGKLLGLLVFCTTVPTQAAVTSDVEFLFLDSPTFRYTAASWGDMHGVFDSVEDQGAAQAAPAITNQLAMQNYGWLDFRDEPIDLIAEDIALSVDAEVTGEAVRFIPVIEVPQ
jgi:hypothetical protein